MSIVFLSQRLPYAPNRGDRVRAYHELRALCAHHPVHVVSLAHDDEEAAHAIDLAEMAASVHLIRVSRLRNLVRGVIALPTNRPLTHTLLDGPDARRVLDAVVERYAPRLTFAYCSSMVRFAFAPPLDRIPFVMDMVDVDSQKWAAMADDAPPPKRWIYQREARCLAPFEGDAVRRSRVTWVVNDREAALLRSVAGPSAPVEVLENGVDVPNLRRPTDAPSSNDVVFCGVMDYAPNEQGAWWLATQVWPSIRTRWPDARLLIVGARPSRRLCGLPGRDPSIVVTGTVPDVRPYLWQGAVSAAPLTIARGVQNKVLEAVAAGLPAVITPAVAGGLPREVLPACSVAESATAFGERLVRLLSMPAQQREAIVSSARLEGLTWEARTVPLLDTVERLLDA